MPISIPTAYASAAGGGIGEDVSDIVSALPPHTNVRVSQLSQRGNRPVRTSEHSLWIGSLPSFGQVLQQASWSLTILMDGELSVVGGHSLCREALRCNLGSPVVSISLAHPFLLGERSAIYQIVYELHLLRNRRRYSRDLAQQIRARPRELGVWQPSAQAGQRSVTANQCLKWRLWMQRWATQPRVGFPWSVSR